MQKQRLDSPGFWENVLVSGTLRICINEMQRPSSSLKDLQLGQTGLGFAHLTWGFGLQGWKRAKEKKERNARVHSHLGNKVPISANPSSPGLGEQWESLITQGIGISELG